MRTVGLLGMVLCALLLIPAALAFQGPDAPPAIQIPDIGAAAHGLVQQATQESESHDSDPSAGRPSGDPEAESQDDSPARDALARVDRTIGPVVHEVGGIAREDPLVLARDRVVNPVYRARAELEAEVNRLVFETPPEPAAQPEAQPNVQASVPASFSTPLLIAAGAAATAGAAVLLWLAGSSSTLGGAAGAAKAGHDLRRLLPLASPLFSRFEKDTVLGHAKREALYALVMQNPGITLQDLCERTNLSRTAATHHLRLLEHHHVVVSKRVGRSRHYYENGGRYQHDQKDAYAVLQNARSRDVAKFIREHPGAIQKDLCAHFGIQPSVVHWHVRRLQEAHLVEPVRRGRTVSYYLAATVPELAA